MSLRTFTWAFRQRKLICFASATDITDEDFAASQQLRWNKLLFWKTIMTKMAIPPQWVVRQPLQLCTWFRHPQWPIQSNIGMYTVSGTNFFYGMHCSIQEWTSRKRSSSWLVRKGVGFFDKHIIPLAEKIEDCGVFGISSNECLQYAQENPKRNGNRKDVKFLQVGTRKLAVITCDGQAIVLTLFSLILLNDQILVR